MQAAPPFLPSARRKQAAKRLCRVSQSPSSTMARNIMDRMMAFRMPARPSTVKQPRGPGRRPEKDRYQAPPRRMRWQPLSDSGLAGP